ncbi:MAG: hypothetical protein ACKV1O_12925 [Saprospiraceae bacterium]
MINSSDHLSLPTCECITRELTGIAVTTPIDIKYLNTTYEVLCGIFRFLKEDKDNLPKDRYQILFNHINTEINKCFDDDPKPPNLRSTNPISIKTPREYKKFRIIDRKKIDKIVDFLHDRRDIISNLIILLLLILLLTSYLHLYLKLITLGLSFVVFTYFSINKKLSKNRVFPDTLYSNNRIQDNREIRLYLVEERIKEKGITNEFGLSPKVFTNEFDSLCINFYCNNSRKQFKILNLNKYGLLVEFKLFRKFLLKYLLLENINNGDVLILNLKDEFKEWNHSSDSSLIPLSINDIIEKLSS